MKTTKWLMLVATTAAPLLSSFAQAPAGQAADTLTPGAAQVVKLAQSGTSDDVLLAYVQNSATPFNLSADQILYLKDVGLSSQVITAMLSRDRSLRGPSYDYTQRNYAPGAPAPAPPPPTVPDSVPTAPPPAPAPAPAAPPPTYVSDAPAEVSYFYSDLSPYGTWVSLPGYGWCWQPTVVVLNSGWRPYCDAGHWVWSDAGWFWASDYSWGWAPFHYGRWHLHPGCGWVWAPDRVWGPAWVTWRTSGDICGWAPLPPRAVFDARLGWSFNGVRVAVGFDFGLSADCFAFIGLKDFCAHDLGHRRLPPAEVTRVYKQTTIVNNYVVQNNVVVNQGVKVERVAAATHTEIRKAAIRDLPAGAARAATDKSSLVVYRPQLNTPSRPVSMVAQKLDERHPVVQHTEMAPANAGRRAATTPTTAPAQNLTPRTVPRTGNDKPSGTRSQLSQPQPSRSASVTPAPAAPKSGSRETASAPAPKVTASATTPRASREESTTTSRPASSSQQASVSPSSRNARAPVEDSKASARSLPGYRSNTQTTTSSHALRTSQDQSGGAASANSHVYYPKSYHQASEIHSLPPENSPAASSAGRASESGSKKSGS